MLDQSFKMSVNSECLKHFDHACSKQYRSWRMMKIEALSDIECATKSVNISSYCQLIKSQKQELIRKCNQFGFVIYQFSTDELQNNLTTKGLRFLAKQLGLSRLDFHYCTEADGISVLQVSKSNHKGSFIPYTDKALGWHTDGYYNAIEHQIRTVILHCVEPALKGGENQLMDHELMYIKLRDRDPKLIDALCSPDCMTIPEFDDGSGNIRKQSTGPVFYFDTQTGRLQMRYSARLRNIRWKDDAETIAARVAITDILSSKESPVIHLRLKAGQGLISNNILHNRTAFVNEEDNRRKVFRARFYDEISSN